jgi:hypothetical protein
LQYNGHRLAEAGALHVRTTYIDRENNMLLRALLVAAALALAAGCTSRPVMNVQAEPVVVTPGKTATAEDLLNANMPAGARLGWAMQPPGPGVVAGTLNLRTHSAVIDVEYNTKTYNIVYRSSTNLDAGNGQIHKNYNGWIQNLNNAIHRELLRV